MKAYLSLVCSGIFLALMGCAKDAEELEDPVLAEVGDSRITASQLIDFEQRLPAQLKTKKSGLDGYRDYLQTVIDKEIFLQEAIKRGLDEIPEVAQKLQREKAERVLSLLFEREFLAKVHVDEQELRAAYEAADKGREVKLRLIIVDTQAEAEEIGQSLADGRDFAELAHSRSQHKSTAPQGGELDGYLTPKRIPIYLQEYINALAVGEYSEPIRLPNGQFGIYQVMHARPVSFATASNELEAKLREEKTTELIEAFLAQLRDDIDLQANAETLQQLQQWVAAGRREYAEAERAVVLFQFRDGSITVEDFWDYAEELKMVFQATLPSRCGGLPKTCCCPAPCFCTWPMKGGWTAKSRLYAGMSAAKMRCCCWHLGRRQSRTRSRSSRRRSGNYTTNGPSYLLHRRRLRCRRSWCKLGRGRGDQSENRGG